MGRSESGAGHLGGCVGARLQVYSPSPQIRKGTTSEQTQALGLTSLALAWPLRRDPVVLLLGLKGLQFPLSSPFSLNWGWIT